METMNWGRKVSFTLTGKTFIGRIIQDDNTTTYKVLTTGQDGNVYTVKKKDVTFLEDITKEMLELDLRRMSIAANNSEEEGRQERLLQFQNFYNEMYN